MILISLFCVNYELLLCFSYIPPNSSLEFSAQDYQPLVTDNKFINNFKKANFLDLLVVE